MRYGHLIMSLFCAWVLWGTAFDKTTGTQAAGSSALNGYEKRDECMKKLDLAAATQTNPKLTWEYACLPDTVDPRAHERK